MLLSAANLSGFGSANCHFRLAAPCGDRLVVSLPPPCERMPSVNAVPFPYYSSGHELTLFFEDFEVSADLPYPWCLTTNTTPSFCDDLDGLLFCFCDACQSAHSVCRVASFCTLGLLTTFVTASLQRRKIKLYGRPYVDHLVLCHCSRL